MPRTTGTSTGPSHHPHTFSDRTEVEEPSTYVKFMVWLRIAGWVMAATVGILVLLLIAVVWG